MSTTATLTLALLDARRRADVLNAAEQARRAALALAYAGIAAEVALEQRKTREMADAFRLAQEQELAAIQAETLELLRPAGEKEQPRSTTPEQQKTPAKQPIDAESTSDKGIRSTTTAPVPSGEKERKEFGVRPPTHLPKGCNALGVMPQSATPPVDRLQVVAISRADYDRTVEQEQAENVLTAFMPPAEPDPVFGTVAEENAHWQRMAGKVSDNKRLTSDEQDPPLLGVPAVNGQSEAAPEVPAGQATPAGKKRNRKGH